jgi:nucleotide-binding universal stress UspA family protein
MLDHILIQIGVSQDEAWTLPHARTIAAALHGRITLVRLLEQTDAAAQFVDPLIWQINRTEAEAQLDRAAEYLHDSGLEVNRAVIEGAAAAQLITYAQDHDINLIVVAHPEKITLDQFHQQLLQGPIPVLMVRTSCDAPEAESSANYQKLMIPLDGSQRAEHILPIATALAEACQTQLLLVHVVRRPEMPRRAPLTQDEVELVERIVERNREEAVHYLEQLENRLSRRVNVESRLLVDDNVARALHQLIDQEEVNLVILSAHGYSGEPQWPYGSITNSIVAYSPRPVLVVQDFPVSPVSTAETVAPREQRSR